MPINEVVKKYDIAQSELQTLLAEALGPDGDARLDRLYESSVSDLKPDKIVKGRVLNIVGDDVIVDVGYKSEGVIPIDQWKSTSATRSTCSSRPSRTSPA